jgi:hypothetical protein
MCVNLLPVDRAILRAGQAKRLPRSHASMFQIFRARHLNPEVHELHAPLEPE